MKKLFSLVLITLVVVGFTKAQVDTVYTQDFSGGIPAGWANFGTSNGSPNAWVKWRRTTTGCRDAYDNGAKMTSPTAANGFLLFDSDSLDNGAQAGNFGNGPAPAPQMVTLTTTAINIASTPFCRLQFYQYFRNLQSNTVVGFSTDSVNWFLDTINASIGLNQNTATNAKVIVDMSPYIAQGNAINNTGKLYISWIMDAYYYFWQIDDILITSLPDYNLTAQQAFGQMGTTGLFYGSIPLSQFASTDSFQAFATYGNTGGVTQTNIRTDFTLFKGTVAEDSAYGSPDVGSLAYGVDTTVTPARQFGTNGIAKYKVATNVISSDSANFDARTNLDSINFSVTDTVFSSSTSTGVGPSAYYLLANNQGNAFIVGNFYEITEQDTATSITTALLGGTGNTSAGSIVQAAIYSATLGASTVSYSTTPVATTYPKTLAAGNITAINANSLVAVTLPINYQTSNAILAPGLYWVAVSATYTPDSNVIIASATTTQLGCLAGVVGPTTAANTIDAFNLGSPYVNLNLGHPASLLWATWSRNPSTSPLGSGRNVTFTGGTNGDNSSVYTWTFYSDSDGVYLNPDTGKTITTSFPPSSSDVTGKDAIVVCVTVTDAGSSATYCNTVLVKNTTGISEVNQLTDVTLVPNPTTGKVNISANGATGPVSISIENMLGDVVRTMEGEGTNGSFSRNYDLSTLSNGLYLVRITSGGGSVTKKLSISK